MQLKNNLYEKKDLGRQFINYIFFIKLIFFSLFSKCIKHHKEYNIYS